MNAENKFIKPETVISTCSLIVAVCAIFISTYQAYLSREHNRISTRPILQFDVDLTYDSLDNDIGLGFKNVGLGPAKIHKMDMLFGNKWINLLDKKKVSEFLESTGLGYWYFSPGNRNDFMAGEQRELIKFINRNSDDSLFTSIHDRLDTMILHLEYSTVYDEVIEEYRSSR